MTAKNGDRSECRVRDYEPGDFEPVQRIWGEVGMAGPKRGDTAAVIARTLTIPGARFFILEDTRVGAIIGTSWITCDGRRLHLHHFVVKPSHQGRGLSHVLLEASLRHARIAGIQIKLEVHRTNDRAVSLYRKAGFETIGDYEVYIIRDPAIKG